MAIIIKTENPNTLLDNIYEGIESKRVEKWAILSDGRLTYSTLLWRNETFFKPEIWVEESWRRTWWLLYHTHASMSASAHALPTQLSGITMTVRLPSEEDQYEAGVSDPFILVLP